MERVNLAQVQKTEAFLIQIQAEYLAKAIGLVQQAQNSGDSESLVTFYLERIGLTRMEFEVLQKLPVTLLNNLPLLLKPNAKVISKISEMLDGISDQATLSEFQDLISVVVDQINTSNR